MKILHYSLGLPPFRSGGLTKYSLDLMNTQQDLENEVLLLYPGKYSINPNQRIIKNKPYNQIKVYELINPLPIPLLNGVKVPELFMKKTKVEVFVDFLLKIKPDVVHIHTLMGLNKEFIEACKQLKIKTVFTTHDYFGICPTVNLLNSNGKVCENFEEGKGCISCNANGFSMPMVFLMQSYPYRYLKDNSLVKQLRQKKKSQKSEMLELDKSDSQNDEVDEGLAEQYKFLRNYYIEMLNLIDDIHYNSTITMNEYQKYLTPKGKYIPISHSNIRDNRIVKNFDKDKPLQLGYIGPMDSYKGFHFLINSLEKLKLQNKKWHLNIYGDDRVIESLEKNYYTFKGRFNYSELERIFSEIDLLIIPSQWKETFGFIGLEAMTHGVPVLVSNTVGFKDVLSNETGMIYDGSQIDLLNKIKSIIIDRNILQKMNQHIVELEFNFSMVHHAKEMISFYKS
ncbi:glycosyltransferase [Bacillus sp. EAC]|uniref:glycosyltransferase n=1 Tax=Bacillus sp. EAC TaxID=1978338 RepID=UPI000B435645|nr:glycosyltransferase [Bacillus sp. EAC]